MRYILFACFLLGGCANWTSNNVECYQLGLSDNSPPHCELKNNHAPNLNRK